MSAGLGEQPDEAGDPNWQPMRTTLVINWFEQLLDRPKCSGRFALWPNMSGFGVTSTKTIIPQLDVER